MVVRAAGRVFPPAVRILGQRSGVRDAVRIAVDLGAVRIAVDLDAVRIAVDLDAVRIPVDLGAVRIAVDLGVVRIAVDLGAGMVCPNHASSITPAASKRTPSRSSRCRCRIAVTGAPIVTCAHPGRRWPSTRCHGTPRVVDSAIACPTTRAPSGIPAARATCP